jgi:hypothetical protein
MSSDDVVDIINVINLYALAVDTLQFDLFDRVFSRDVSADFGGAAKWQDIASLKRDFVAIHSPFDATQHTTTNHQVIVENDHASAMSYVHGRFVRKVAEGGNMFESCGWYDDKLVRTTEGWRITHRLCRTIWNGGNPRVLQTMPGVTVEPELHSLSGEASARKLSYLDALRRKSGEAAT